MNAADLASVALTALTAAACACSGKMLRDDIMPLMQDPSGQVNADAYSAAQFFGKMCAPR